MHDPTGEYQRQELRLRVSRKADVVFGIIELCTGVVGIPLLLIYLVYALWSHSTNWYAYGLALGLLVFCGSMIWLGRLNLQTGKRAVTSSEVNQAKQARRQELHQAVQGQLPIVFSKGSRYHYAGMAILFGALGVLGWYELATSGPSANVLGLLITGMVIFLIYLALFLNTFAGKLYQRASGAELRRILQAGEFAAPEASDSSDTGETTL
jgi:hypothetical protein